MLINKNKIIKETGTEIRSKILNMKKAEKEINLYDNVVEELEETLDTLIEEVSKPKIYKPKVVILDIETGKCPDAIPPEFEEPKRKKDGELYAKAKTIEEQRQEWESKCALSGLTGRVLAIGFRGSRFGQPPTRETIERIHSIGLMDGEKELLEWFWTWFNHYIGEGYIIAGWNIRKFDLPFLIQRSWKWNVPVYLKMDGAKNKIIDLMEEFTQTYYGMNFASLDTALQFLALGAKSEYSKDYEKLFFSDKVKALKHLSKDLSDTLKVAERIL